MRFIIFILLVFGVQELNAQRLLPIAKKRKWGYMNAEGQMKTAFKYDLALPYNNGYAMAALNRMPCLINLNDKRVIDTGIYQYIGNYSEGLVSVMDYKFKRYYLDTNGNKVLMLDKDIYDASGFNRGLAKVSKKIIKTEQKYGFDVSNLEYKFAFINKQGNYITDFIFDDCDDFTTPVVRFLQGTNFGLLDTNGQIIVTARYANMSSFNEGLAVVSLNGKFGFINQAGIEVIKPVFDYARMFSNGLAAVYVGNKIGFINTNGEMIIPPQFDAVRPFGENRCAVLVTNKWGIIDNKGLFIYNPMFDDAGVYSNGVCPIKKGGKWGAIDMQGRVVVPFEFEYIGTFDNGIAEVIINGINLYVNTMGKLLPLID